MYENVFKRVEEKYLLTEDEYKNLFSKISKYLEKDKYHKATICNIYFDTNHSDLIINSLEKPIFKEKIRLRSYRVPNLNDEVFLEIKEGGMYVCLIVFFQKQHHQLNCHQFYYVQSYLLF